MKKLTLVILLLFGVAQSASALTLAQTRTAVDTYIDSIEAAARTQIQACLANQENCQTAWSCSAPCNTTVAAGSICQNTQSDLGEPDACGVASGVNTFASRGINLPAQAPVCFKLNVYSGPSGRGGNLCYKAQHNGITYIKCRGFGPQAAFFTQGWAVAP